MHNDATHPTVYLIPISFDCYVRQTGFCFLFWLRKTISHLYCWNEQIYSHKNEPNKCRSQSLNHRQSVKTSSAYTIHSYINVYMSMTNTTYDYINQSTINKCNSQLFIRSRNSYEFEIFAFIIFIWNHQNIHFDEIASKWSIFS